MVCWRGNTQPVRAAPSRLLLLLFLALAPPPAGGTDDGGQEYDQWVVAAEQCSRLRNDAPEDTNSGFPTFVAARPSVVLDLSQCISMPAGPRINLAAQCHGGRASAAFTQGGWDASAVIDGIASEPDNGWAYIGLVEKAFLNIHLAPPSGSPSGDGGSSDSGEANVGDSTTAAGENAASALAARVVIVSGSGRMDHHLTSFRLWVASGDAASGSECTDAGGQGGGDAPEVCWIKLPGLSSRHADVSVAEDGVSVAVKAGVGEVVLDFPPRQISALRLKVDGSDAESNNNAIINEVEVLTSDGLAGDRRMAEMTVYVNDESMGTPRYLPLPSPGASATAMATPFLHRIWLPNEAGVHEVRVQLDGALNDLHVTMYEKLPVGLKAHIAFPPETYTFGRAMLPFIRVGAEGFQCLGGQPLDNSTGGCWAQPFDTYYITLQIQPIEGSGIDLLCQLWEDAEDMRHCTQVCGGVNRAKGAGHGQGDMHRCCDFGNYAELMRSGRYIGLSCLPEGQFRLTVRFYDYYKVYSERHQVMIAVDRTDMGLWYHRGAAEASYLDAVQAAMEVVDEGCSGPPPEAPAVSDTGEQSGDKASEGARDQRAAGASGEMCRDRTCDGAGARGGGAAAREGCSGRGDEAHRRWGLVLATAENVTRALDVLVYSCTCAREPYDYLEGGGERWRFREEGRRDGQVQVERSQCCAQVSAVVDVAVPDVSEGARGSGSGREREGASHPRACRWRTIMVSRRGWSYTLHPTPYTLNLRS